MGNWPKYPVIYEINTWAWLKTMSLKAGKLITLGNIPRTELEPIANYGFDAVWLMGVWQRSPRGREIDRQDPNLLSDCRKALSDYTREDVVGSPYAIYSYQVDPMLGSNEHLATLRKQLLELGLRLILDFVPNHLAIDHPWLREYPERFVQGSQDDLNSQPNNYFSIFVNNQKRIFAHGRDPYFGGWLDTVQLDYRFYDTHKVMTKTLVDIAAHCDGVRCDMAMLITHDVFIQTWGGEFATPMTEFWPSAIEEVRKQNSDFLMLAEVYWGMEYKLQQQGFDYTYDKVLYDRLIDDDTISLRSHLQASLEYQSHLMRFIENHDEQRASVMFRGTPRSLAAATIALTLPGLRLLHDGQIEGRRVKVPVQLARYSPEPIESNVEVFYNRLLTALSNPVFHEGQWEMLEPRKAWDENNSYLSFIAYYWILNEERRLVIVNLSPNYAQCYLPVQLESDVQAEFSWHLHDLLNHSQYYRDGTELKKRGLYVSLPGYGCHLFELKLQSKKQPLGLARQCSFREHTAGIYGIAWSPNGRTMASADLEKRIWLWDADSCDSICSLDRHLAEISMVTWSPNGRLLASGSYDNTIYLWDTENRTVCYSLTGHSDHILSLVWSPNGKLLASAGLDKIINLWDVETGKHIYTFGGHTEPINCLAWSSDGKTLASGSGDRVVNLWDIESRELQHFFKEQEWIGSIVWLPSSKLLAVGTGGGVVSIWDVENNRRIVALEGHTDRILCVEFSFDGRLLASKSADNTVRFWRCDTWKELAVLEEHGIYLSGLAFHPQKLVLATRDDKENAVHIWHLDIEVLFNVNLPTSSEHYVNAKVVLVGESGVGKSGLGVRMVEKQFRPTESTHGAQFWQFLIPHGQIKNIPTDTQAELTLWDLAGQSEYHIIHQLFLDDTDVALVLFDCSDSTTPFSGVPYWAKVLKKHAPPHVIKYLVSSRCDVSPTNVSQEDINRVLVAYGLQAYFCTSAKTGEGVELLFQQIIKSIHWDKLTYITRPYIFQVIRKFLLERKETNSTFITMKAVHNEVKLRYPERSITQAEIDTVIRLLQSKGLIYQLDPTPNLSLVLLRPDLINQYGSSIIQAARHHPQGLGTIPERDVITANLPFSHIERLEPTEEKLILESTVELFIRHDLCFREMGLLVFPSQLNLSRPRTFEKHLPAEVNYKFSGSIEAIYASLVVRLSHTGYFQREEQWKYAAEFSRNGYRLGFTMQQTDGSSGDLEIYFNPKITDFDRVTFVRFVTDHLQSKGIDIQERIRLYCPQCGAEVEDQNAIAVRIQVGALDIPCQYCTASVIIPRSIEEKYRSDTTYREVQQELITRVEKKTSQEAEAFREEHRLYIQPQEHRLNILHLSDIHISEGDATKVCERYFTQLEIDLEQRLGVNRLDYMVISGDVTHNSLPEEYEVAFIFVNKVVKRFGLDSSRVIIVPGNHDLNWDLAEDAYLFVPKRKLPLELSEGYYVPAGDAGALVRQEEIYQQRFAHFNNYFYKKVYGGRHYPLDYAHQGILTIRPDDRILFLTLNSSWQLDHYYSKRAGINMDALSHSIAQLDNNYEGWLKIAVWHHPIDSQAAINDGFMQILADHGFQICMHGHIHESIDTYHEHREKYGLYIIGAGAFGSPTEQDSTKIPLSYNLLRLNPKTGLLTVKARKRITPDDEWLQGVNYNIKLPQFMCWDMPQSIIGLDIDRASLRPITQSKLRQILIKNFNIEELRSLGFDMGIDIENLVGGNSNKSVIARELISHFQHLGRFIDLVSVCYQLRPKADW